MPARARKPEQPTTIEVGGVTATPAQIQQAIDVLNNSKGIQVKSFLVKAENPLAECDYQAVAEEQGPISLDPQLQTKPAFIAALQRKLAGE